MVKFIFIPGFINSVELATAPSDLEIVGFNQLLRDNNPALDQKLTFDDQYDYLEKQLNRSNRYIAFGDSMGATFATYLAFQNPKNIIGLVFGDYVPRYQKLTTRWVDQMMQIEQKSVDNTVIKGLARDSKEIDFTEILLSLHCPIMILKGEKSRFSFEQLPKRLRADCRIIPNAGHDIFQPQPDIVWKHISDFARKISPL
ncbi:MAG: alpha/beta hydrolase [Chitinophagaceae bacterium]|nr:MAG: alpha/beta hydrolase [Chitinophagaceae bacterium]